MAVFQIPPHLHLLAFLLAGLISSANADPQVFADACATTDPAILSLFDATVYLPNLNYQQITKNPDGTYALTPIGTYTTSPDGPLDPTSLYYGDPQAPAGHTGVLISNKTVLTSAHSLPFGYTSYLYILGLYAKSVGGNCQYPDLQHIPHDDVYFASTGSPGGSYNGVVLNTWSPAAEQNDFVLITVDRQVVGHTPLPARKSGFALPSDRLAAVHFSQRLIPVKGDFAIAHTNETSPAGMSIANASLTPGSSGGPIFNLDVGVIETVASLGNSCMYFNSQPSGLYLLSDNCPGAFYPVNGPITAISTLPGFTDVDLIFRTGFDQ
jgi:Trypsin-like peptidase domain